MTENVKKTPVAQMIKIEGDYSRRTVREEDPPYEKVKVEKFVNGVFPGQVIEHLGRTELVKVQRWGGVSPSSLFFQTVHKAYAGHHALGLRPEVLMYLINAVVAETVKRYPEEYRHLFTAEPGKVDIHVRHDGLVLGDPNSPWNETITRFYPELCRHVPSRLMSTMLPALSTATIESTVASLVAFMDAASPFYDYHTHTMCGIPRVVLFGEAGDYRKLVDSAESLAVTFEKHLKVYFENLIPVLETIAKTAESGIAWEDKEFWGQIYKQYEMSGTDSFSGWMTAFVWYVQENGVLVVKDKELADWKRIGKYNGVDSGSEPSHVSRVPFTWHYFDKKFSMHFIGGVLGIDVEEDALTPVLSYGVLRAKAE